MSACWDNRAIRNDSDENRVCIATSSHLEQAVTTGGVVNRERRVSVVINLNKVVALTSWSTRSQFANQDGAWLICDQYRTSGLARRSDRHVHWIRQRDEERLVLFVFLVVRQDRYQDRLDLFTLSEVNRSGRRGVILTRRSVVKRRCLVLSGEVHRCTSSRRRRAQRHREHHVRRA